MIEGPAHEALADVVRDSLRYVAGAYPEDVVVEALPNPKVASFRVDLQPVFRHESSNLRAQCAELAAVLSRYDSVERAAAIPPRVYIEPELGFFEQATVAHVIDQWMDYGIRNVANGRPVNVNFTSPNANKPLHIGHLRISFTGMAVANLFAAQGWDVERSEILSDYGVHICQALAAYLKWGNGETPGQAGVRGDKFAGSYYVKFHQENQRLREAAGITSDENAAPTALEQEALDLLHRMERGDEELLALNHRFCAWAIDGIRETYRRIDTWHDYSWMEYELLPLGRAAFEQMIGDGVVQRRPDGSAYIDLTDKNLGTITVLRRDNSPLVFVQLVSVWLRRYALAPEHVQIHVGGDQWESGIAAVLEMVSLSGLPEAAAKTERCNVGMVRMPEGKLRSRTGEALTADDVLDSIRDELAARWAAATAEPLDAIRRQSCDMLAVGLVKYHVLTTERTKELVYDEQRLWNETLPRFARVVALLAADEEVWHVGGAASEEIPPFDQASAGDARRAVCLQLNLFPMTITRACERRDPAMLVRFLDNLANNVNGVPVDDIALRRAAAIVLRRGLEILNVQLPTLLREVPPEFAPATRS